MVVWGVEILVDLGNDNGAAQIEALLLANQNEEPPAAKRAKMAHIVPSLATLCCKAIVGEQENVPTFLEALDGSAEGARARVNTMIDEYKAESWRIPPVKPLPPVADAEIHEEEYFDLLLDDEGTREFTSFIQSSDSQNSKVLDVLCTTCFSNFGVVDDRRARFFLCVRKRTLAFCAGSARSSWDVCNRAIPLDDSALPFSTIRCLHSAISKLRNIGITTDGCPQWLFLNESSCG